MPKCSFIVSAYDRPDALALLLLSLKLQTEPDFEVLICDNSATIDNFTQTVEKIMDDDPRFKISWTGDHCRNCYASANRVVEIGIAKGDYLCFPSDDGYYVPNFLKFMLTPGTDLVLCDWLTDVRHINGSVGAYVIRRARPRVNEIDKGGFLVRRSKFRSFPWEQDIITADGLMVASLLKDPSLTIDKAPGVLWVHN